MTTTVILTPLQQAYLQAKSGVPGARERLAVLLHQEQQAEASRGQVAARAATEADTNAATFALGLVRAGLPTMQAAAQEAVQAQAHSERVQSRPSTSGAPAHSVTVERAYAPPAAQPYVSDGITSQHGGHHAVTISRPNVPPSAPRDFTSSGVETRPDGSQSVTIIPR